MLDVSKLSRSYGDLKAVDDVSFRIGQGEIVGLLGHNGAGKTTIMKMISGYLEPDAGQVILNGMDLSMNLKTVQGKIGYLPESLLLYPDMSVAYFLDYAASLKGLTDTERRHREIRRVIEATALQSKSLEPIATLSRGQKQRVGVAQALLGSPGLLILDEPTSGLDPTQTEHMRALIRDLASTTTVILSTHIMQEVEAICDRVLIINNGRLVLDEQLAQLQTANRIQVRSDLDPLRIEALAAAHTGIRTVSPDPERGSCLIELSEDADNDAVTASLASAILDAGGRLYQLASESRSLETLFRELSAGQPEAPQATEEVNNAA